MSTLNKNQARKQKAVFLRIKQAVQDGQNKDYTSKSLKNQNSYITL